MIKNLVSEPILIQIFPALPKKIFLSFVPAKCYSLLQAVTVCNFKENYRTKLEKMAKKLVLGPILDPLAQICNPTPNLFSWILPLLDVRNYHIKSQNDKPI